MKHLFVIAGIFCMFTPSLHAAQAKVHMRARSFTDSELCNFNQKIFHRARRKNKLIAKEKKAQVEREKAQLQQQKAATWQSIAVMIKSPKNQPVDAKKRVSPSQEACEYSWDKI